MVCVDCAERRQKLRDAIMHGKMAKALDITVEGLRVMIGIDARADHREEAKGPLDLSIPDLKAYLATVTDPEAIESLIDQEQAGKTRDGAIAALVSRRDALLAD